MQQFFSLLSRRFFYKRQDNKLKNCCIRLVIYLNCTMMHGITKLKVRINVTQRHKDMGGGGRDPCILNHNTAWKQMAS